MLKRLKLIILLLLTATVLPAWSQSDSVRVSLITYYPGHEIYELFGHTELRVVDGFSDNFYNYGMFDFNTPNFAYPFRFGQDRLHVCRCSCKRGILSGTGPQDG
jgi:hypothetical protein